MKICYYIVGGDSLKSGYFQKINATVRMWQALGCETLVCIGTREHSDCARTFHGHSFPGEAILWTWASGFTRFKEERKAAKRIIDWKPDVVYIRSAYFTPGIVPLLKAAPGVAEINTNEDVERRQYGFLHYSYFRLSSSYFLPNLAGIIAVTNEIASLPFYRRTGKPIEVIANGITLSDLPHCPVSAAKNPVLLMLAASSYTWHGVDKLAALARTFPDWSIEIAGDFPLAPELKRYPNIKSHGYLNRENLSHVLSRAHVGIGSLAMHRKNMEEGCVLKTREYLAHGLPVILGYKDTDFPEGAEFLLQIGNYEGNVSSSLNQISEFVHRWMKQRVSRREISHLDNRAKEESRLNFFRKVARLPQVQGICA